MGEYINKHVIKIQIGVLISVLGVLLYWAFTASAYVYQIEENTRGRLELENKFETLATKQDLQSLKQDIKDFIIK